MQEQSQIVYFLSDFHLGIDAQLSSRVREGMLCHFLDRVLAERADLYILGDIFDFWFEYKHVVPKGSVRFVGKLCELHDAGIKIEIFTGNHDMWMFGYFEKEIGIMVHKKPLLTTIQDKRIFMAHGDGLGPGDQTFKQIRKVFTSRIAQTLFSWIHPDIGITFAQWWSGKSRVSHSDEGTFLGDDKEFLIQFAYDYLKKEHVDIFIFGHRHLPMLKQLEGTESTYCNLGDWILSLIHI